MGKLRACLAVAVCALAACGDDGGNAKIDAAVAVDAKIFMDAAPDAPPMFDLTCVGNTAPTTAAANITLAGFAQQGDINLATQMFETTPIVDATVKACDTTACNGPADGNDTTDAAGDWSIGPIATGGVPLNDYLAMTKTGQRTTFVYPHAPFVADQPGIPIVTFGPFATSFLGSIGTCDTADPLLILAVTDCANMPITDTTNVNIIILQGGNPVATAEVHDLAETIPGGPAQLAGLFLVCGVPANDATNVGATYNGMTLLAHDVKTVDGTTTATQIRAGY